MSVLSDSGLEKGLTCGAMERDRSEGSWQVQSLRLRDFPSFPVHTG